MFEASGSAAEFDVMKFATGEDDIAFLAFVAPSDVNLSANWKLDIHWFADDVGPSENAVWTIETSATSEGDVDDVIEQDNGNKDTVSENVNETEATRLIISTIDMQVANLDGVAPGDLVIFKFTRDVSEDNLSSDAQIIMWRLRVPRDYQ